ncbi:MAG: hypothetical protein QQN63_05215 [Nitrosopumilus sp.]
MSIKTTGQLQGQDLKTDPVGAGFVKNDVDGNFLFGQTGSAWTFLETKVLTSPATHISFTGLVGLSDRAYRLVWENPFDVGTPTITDGRIFFRRESVLVPTNAVASVSTNLIGNTAAVTFTNHPFDLLISNMIVPSGPVPFINSGIVEYTIRRSFTGAESGSGKCISGREINSYPSIPQIDGRWIGGWDANSSGSTLSSIGISAAQTDMLRPGSVWSLYKIDSTP